MGKKDCHAKFVPRRALVKLLTVMKLTVFIILFTSFQSIAINVNSQRRINLDLKSESLATVFSLLESKYNYRFFYSDNVALEKQKVDIFAKRATIDEVMQHLLHNTLYTYKTMNKDLVVVIGPENMMLFPVNGKITNENGEPLSGVSVLEKGTNNGTTTAEDGTFSLNVENENAILVISNVGYTSVELSVKNDSYSNIVLKVLENRMDEVVVVGYGTQRAATVTGSISSVKGDELTVAPVASTANSLAGRLPGLISLQSSGQPGFDAASLSIRGFGGALVIVDGIESSFNNIDANEIESITILKDGSASIYGSRAGNGVILVTTKRGGSGSPVITLNTSYTRQGITSMPRPASSGQYSEMKREEWVQSGKPEETAPFTLEQIKKYYDGTDPLYPNTDWYKELIRDWAPQHQHNLSVRGGSSQIKYYGFLGYTNQETIWKKNGGNYKRYNIRSNIDAKILDNLSLQLDVSSIYEIRNFPWRSQGAGANTVWQDFWNTLPIYPPSLPDPTKISFANGGGTGGAHVITNSEIAGYDNTISQNLKGTLALDYAFKAIQGLSTRVFVDVSQDYTSNKHFTRPVQFYTYDPQSDKYTLAGALGSTASLSQYNSNGRAITGQFSFNYDKSLGLNHHLKILTLYEAIDYNNDYLTATRINFLTPAIDQMFAGSTEGMTNNGSASEMGRASYIGRINYSFKEKYLLETILRADASAKFPARKRWGYFPSISLGWRLSDEDFIVNTKGIDNLKLRVSYGESGNDGVGNFQYLSGYQYGLTHILDNRIQQGISSTGLANPNLTWEKISIYNFGVDFSFWGRKLYGVGDIFYRERNGIPASRINTLPSTFGANLPPENINSLNDRGFELQLGTSANVEGVIWDLSGNISWSRAKWNHFEEPDYKDPDQARIYKRSGRWTDIQFGYLSDGLFTSQQEIDDLNFDLDNQGNVSLRPGDIRFLDVNKDGALNWKDLVEIGKGTVPHWMFGLNANLQYKDFDLSGLFQGAFGYYNYVVLTHGILPPAIVYDLRWTQENNNLNASVPRLGGASTNGSTSDYYYKKAGYMRLKTFALGYNLPNRMLNTIKMKKIRVYIAGNNLLTFDKLKKFGIDPEAPSQNAGYYYPQQRTITIGANLTF